jgi:hypothetical protein
MSNSLNTTPLIVPGWCHPNYPIPEEIIAQYNAQVQQKYNTNVVPNTTSLPQNNGVDARPVSTAPATFSTDLSTILNYIRRAFPQCETVISTIEFMISAGWNPTPEEFVQTLQQYKPSSPEESYHVSLVIIYYTTFYRYAVMFNSQN